VVEWEPHGVNAEPSLLTKEGVPRV
jgi:hypothetical protein